MVMIQVVAISWALLQRTARGRSDAPMPMMEVATTWVVDTGAPTREAAKITPGLQSPTISALHEDGWVAVRAMVLQGHTNQVMDSLYDLGARGILVTPILACRI